MAATIEFDIDKILDDLLMRAARAGMNQPQLCDRAGIANATIIRWRKRNSSPTLSKIEDLEKAISRAQQTIDRAEAS